MSQSGNPFCVTSTTPAWQRNSRLVPSLVILLLSAFVSGAFADTATVALWTFESPNIPAPFTGMTSPLVSPASGNGSAFGFHSRDTTIFSSPVGNGSDHSFGATDWTSGDYWQFRGQYPRFPANSIEFRSNRQFLWRNELRFVV